VDATHPAPRGRGLTAIDGAIALIAVLLVVQMWLLSATLNQFLAGHPDVVVPAAIVSGLLFLACLALYLFIERVDRIGRQSLDSEPMSDR
jgi:hypothetical protein